MKWIELTVYTTDEGIDAVCAALTGVGLESLSIEQSRAVCALELESSVAFWDFADLDKIGTNTPCVKTYLEDNSEQETIIAQARTAIDRLKTQDDDKAFGSLSVTVARVDDEDWANNWKKYYKPLNIGERLLVLPSWEPAPQTDRVILKLDPGMAFGTGAHQTTRMCLEYLEKTVKAGDTVLDLGCGSGILAIAARLLGAKNTIAVDIDPIAESIARENAALNGLDDENYKVLIGNVLTDEELQCSIKGQYPIVVANIVANVIIALAPLAKRLVQKRGMFITSGIIAERKDEVVTALKGAGFEIIDENRNEDWCAILCRG
ncbi:MAG: 50S ribosomal protein L11 methyltransferase [Eubacteriales bacterium]|nr:50S ribosomal protein L11 methyltransferase [Eubacteriales bacterium]